jgi:phage shock protein C
MPGAAQQAGAMNTTTVEPENQTRPQALSRPVDDRMLAGVAAGIARYLGVDVTLVRIGFAVLAIVGGAGVPIYLAGWLLIPEEGSDQSIASEFTGSRRDRSH